MEAPVLSAQTDTIDATADPLPGEFAWPRVLRRLLVLAAVLAGAVALVSLLPGLDSVRDAFAGARWEWLVVAALLEVLSCLSYVVVFRAVFCPRMPWRASYEIGAAELATNSVVSVGGAGGLALLRSRDLAVIAGAAGYMLFDVAMLGVCFAAFGVAVPPAGVLLMAYLIGQLGGLIPLPGGSAATTAA